MKNKNKKYNYPKFKVNSKENNWKVELKVIYNDFQYIRAKIYEKTIERLTSLGVNFDQVQDPLKKLLLTAPTNKWDKYHRDIFSSNH